MLVSPTPAAWPRRVWSPPSTPLERGRLAVVVALVVLTASAWALTVYQARTMDPAMGIAAPADPNETGAVANAADRHARTRCTAWPPAAVWPAGRSAGRRRSSSPGR